MTFAGNRCAFNCELKKRRSTCYKEVVHLALVYSGNLDIERHVCMLDILSFKMQLSLAVSAAGAMPPITCAAVALVSICA